MMKKNLLPLAAAALLCVGIPLAGKDPAPPATAETLVRIPGIPADRVKGAEEAARNKKSVMTRMMQLFLEQKPPMALLTRPFTEAAPDCRIIPGKDGMATLIYRCRYIDPEFLTDAMEALSSEGGAVELIKKFGSEANEFSQIIIRDKAEKMEEFKNVLLGIDVLQPQVLVEAQVIEVYSEQGAERDVKLTYEHYDAKYDTNNKFGFNLDSPVQSRGATMDQGGGFDFVPYAYNGSDGSSGQLTAAIRWLNTSRNARLLSAPNVIADQGSEATITTAEELPIPETAALTSSTNLSFKYKQVGVTLKITPGLINGKTVQLTVNPQVRSVLRYEAFKQDNVTSNIPVISVRSVDTRLTVADGDIIVLGGLYSSEKAESLRKVPYIGDIPLIGDLLNGRDSSSVDKQLVFLLKVHIIHPSLPETPDLEQTAGTIRKTSQIIEASRKLFSNRPAADFADLEELLNEEGKNRIELRQNKRSILDALKEFFSGDSGEKPAPEKQKE